MVLTAKSREWIGIDGNEIDVPPDYPLRAFDGARAPIAWFVAALVGLGSVNAEASVDVPSALIGSWTKVEGGSTGNPALVALSGGSAVIDGEYCVLDTLRSVHSRRWYVDFRCGPAGARVWLDVNLLAENRMMANRRPLAEADLYLRQTPAAEGASP